MNVLRRTKIIATLGPATDDMAVLEKMILAGTDLVRANFSHGSAAEHEKRINAVRATALKHGRPVGVLADLQGPKIRISRFQEGKVFLKEGHEFILDADLASDAGTSECVGIDYKQLVNDVAAGDTLLLDDGRIVFFVKKITGKRIICRVEVGGELSNNKGINRQGGGLSAKALTDKDRADLISAIKLGADYIAISFPRSAADMEEARALVVAAGGTAGLIAKIERHEAVTELDDIIKASDAVMVARGDLGVEIGDAELPGAQKHIIQRARALDKAVITATQMMESMIVNTIPTRAEVFDVANAVLDGTDAVMLSAETATGAHPDKVVAAMARVCLGAEQQRSTRVSGHRVECEFSRVDEAVAMATMYTANHFRIKAIVALTESGSTPLWMSRIRSGIPIYGFTRHVSTERKMTLYRGVYPVHFEFEKVSADQVDEKALAELRKLKLVDSGEWVIITRGDVMRVHGGTNTMKLVQVT
jgi:pyruvate kinase